MIYHLIAAFGFGTAWSPVDLGEREFVNVRACVDYTAWSLKEFQREGSPVKGVICLTREQFNRSNFAQVATHE